MAITREDLAKWTWRGTLFLDMDTEYSNHFVCVENPRLRKCEVGPKTGPRGEKSLTKAVRVWLVDGIKANGVDEILRLLNNDPKDNKEPQA